MKLMLSYLKPFRKRMIVGFIIKVFGTVIELFIPYILTHILKNIVVKENVGLILLWGGVMVLFAMAACISNIVANRMSVMVSRNFSERMRKELFSRTMNLSASQTDKFTIPSLESRITTDTYNVHNFISMMQRLGVRAPILLIGGIAITLVMDAHLSLVMIALLPFIFVAIYSVLRNGVPLYSKVQKSVDGMVGVVREDVQGIRVIKALSKNKHENERYDVVNKKLSSDEKRAGIIMGAVNPIMTFLMNGGIIAVVAYAALRVSKGTSDPETVIAFIQYFTLISMAMMSLSRMVVMYTKCTASAKRIAEVIETDSDLVVIPNEEEFDYSKPHITFENVSFSYNGKQNDLEGVSFSLNKGQNLGIIGATGSGKSTLVKLLLRFYNTSQGRISIFGKDINSIGKQEFTKMFGVALQNDFIYADTVEENIKFGRELSCEDVIAAAKTAQAFDFIDAFPDKFQHQLSSKGTNVSGGQRQRLLISRAIAANPDILILDDSSSALDYKTDANLRRALKENLKNTTVITVAQRVSSVKDCDLIIVLENGLPIGIGSHEYLLSSCLEYKEISDSQMGGAIIE